MVDYYGELCTRMYESNKSIAVGKEFDFFLSFVKDKNMKVLEPMCGNGRMLIPFMQEGIDIDGYDISDDMLKLCKEKCEKLNLSPNVFNDKIEEFKSNKKYDLIMIPFGSFSLLPDHLVDQSLDNLKLMLKEDGKILLTIITKKSEPEELHDWVQTNYVQFNDETIIESKKVQFDEINNMLHTKLKYELMKEEMVVKTEVMDFPMRLYVNDEFKNILKINGLQQVVIHEVVDGYGTGTSFKVFECSI
ncbi:bifunctional 2-polyprenyl-6-hydroxyphenol methylase/3-demethylubiquinol 3-O-methyltransferase UbiG [Bacillus sp. EAC]|uniref:class I SAM-dependent methyltransferase n=1 Tax=Bacillus sp. EAC TaxID=1978338 RepID=UPI000B431866|nr:class I SAM-dependent methyltransferase [Bacillus sp. EAC]